MISIIWLFIYLVLFVAALWFMDRDRREARKRGRLAMQEAASDRALREALDKEDPYLDELNVWRPE